MMRIMTMMWLLLSFHLMGPFPVVVSPTYHTVEDNNITIGWDFHITTDLSLTNLICLLLSKPPKVLYEMRNGVEVPESQHQQFTGRVQLDKDALRGGRFRLDLSTVTAEDSGNYRCEVVANYDKTRSTWEFDASETFVLNVNQVAYGDNGDVSVNTETSGAETTQAATDAPDPERETGGWTLQGVLKWLVLLADSALLACFYLCIKCIRRVKHSDHSVELEDEVYLDT